MSTENAIGLPIPVGVITPENGYQQQTEVIPAKEPNDLASATIRSVDALWLAPMKFTLAATLATAALSLNPFFALKLYQPGKPLT